MDLWRCNYEYHTCPVPQHGLAVATHPDEQVLDTDTSIDSPTQEVLNTEHRQITTEKTTFCFSIAIRLY